MKKEILEISKDEFGFYIQINSINIRFDTIKINSYQYEFYVQFNFIMAIPKRNFIIKNELSNLEFQDSINPLCKGDIKIGVKNG